MTPLIILAAVLVGLSLLRKPTEAGHEERCDVCGRWGTHMNRLDPALNTWMALICDDCLSEPGLQ